MSLYEFQFCMASTNSVYLTSHPISHKCVLFFYTLPKIYIWFVRLLLIKIFKDSTFLRPLLYTLPTYSIFPTKGFMCFTFLWPLKKYIYPTTVFPTPLQPILWTYDSSINQLSNFITHLMSPLVGTLLSYIRYSKHFIHSLSFSHLLLVIFSHTPF